MTLTRRLARKRSTFPCDVTNLGDGRVSVTIGDSITIVEGEKAVKLIEGLRELYPEQLRGLVFP
jgi:hypothetical protein